MTFEVGDLVLVKVKSNTEHYEYKLGKVLRSNETYSIVRFKDGYDVPYQSNANIILAPIARTEIYKALTEET